MDLLEIINTRRSIRQFTDKKVSEDDLKKIIEAGLRAPSSKNICNWHILVLVGHEKDEVANWITENDDNKSTLPFNLETGKSLDIIPDKIKDSTNASVKIIRNASAIIIIFNKAPFTLNKKSFINLVDQSNIYTFVTEILGLGACMENMLLAIHALGLGGVAIADMCIAEKKIKEKYQFNYDFAIGIALGYHNCVLDKKKLKVEKNIDKHNLNMFSEIESKNDK